MESQEAKRKQRQIVVILDMNNKLDQELALKIKRLYRAANVLGLTKKKALSDAIDKALDEYEKRAESLLKAEEAITV